MGKIDSRQIPAPHGRKYPFDVLILLKIIRMEGATHGISDNLEKMGINVEYVGSLISGYIEEGYTPMVV